MLKKSWWLSAPLLIIGALFYLPLLRILLLSSGKDHSLFPNLPHLLFFTAWQAAISTAVTILLALPLANLIYLKHHQSFSILKSLIFLPFILPAISIAICFNNFGPPLLQIIAACTFINLGFATNLIGSALRASHTEQTLAAAMDGANSKQIFWRILLPTAKHQIVATTALVFLYCATDYGVVTVLGGGQINTLETELFRQSVQNLNLNWSRQLVLAQLVLALITLKFATKRPEFTQLDDARELPRFSLPEHYKAIIMCVPTLVLLIWPVTNLLIHLGPFPSAATWHKANELLPITLLGTLYNSARNAIVATCLVLILAFAISRRPKLRTIFQMPAGISGVILGFGYLVTFTSGLFPLRSSWLVLPIATAVIAMPVAVLVLGNAIDQLDPAVNDAALVDGGDGAQRFFLVLLPNIAPVLRTVIGAVALISLGEFGLASFLAYGDQSTLPLLMVQLFNRPGADNFNLANWLNLFFLLGASMLYFVTTAGKISRRALWQSARR